MSRTDVDGFRINFVDLEMPFYVVLLSKRQIFID